MNQDKSRRILVLTVGTGDVTRIEETLLAPLRKSISQGGPWSKVVLLPSKVTAKNAEVLRDEMSDILVDVRPLVKKGDEDNADACYAHFDAVLEKLLHEHAPHEILVDFTRGTKGMSAALVAAAVRRDIPSLRYITSPNRDERGMVVPGTEIIRNVHTNVISAQKSLDEAYSLFRRGNFSAVIEVLPDPNYLYSKMWPPELFKKAETARSMATFYSNWDRLDYKEAARDSPVKPASKSRWLAFYPPAKVKKWVENLAEPLPKNFRKMAARLRLLVADLLANGERCIRDRRYEDAIIRAYRVLELVGQLRLFDKGYDSSRLPTDDPEIKKVIREIEKKRHSQLQIKRDRTMTSGREQTARILRSLGDPFGKKLFKLGENTYLQPKIRNNSLLIHGFEAVGKADDAPLRKLYRLLESLLIEDDEGAPERLSSARFPDFTRHSE